MSFRSFLSTLWHYIQTFWQWVKPYLKKLHHWRKRCWKKYHVTKIIVLLVLVMTLMMTVYLFFVAKSTKVSELESGLKATTVFYDETNEEAGRASAQKGTYVDLNHIAPSVVDALISTEDRRFYAHHGFDIKGIGRAAVRALINRNTDGGGGSTITQQLAKNAYLTLDQTFNRKAKELFLAIEIEKKYSKNEILTMYLNKSYFGNGVWGIQDAAKKYFGVDAKDLSIGEAATLVGQLKGPTLYNPLDAPEDAKNRRATVLDLMVKNGKLDRETAQEQEKIPLEELLYDAYNQKDAGYTYPYYFDAVLNEAEKEYGLNADDLMNKGYKIYTSLNQNYQQSMQETYDDSDHFPENAADGTMVQSASVALNPSNGGVQALVGRRGEYTFRGFNFATDMKRSPGSTIKPLSVYTPALEAGYKADSVLEDKPQSFYKAKNYDGTYEGEVPLYQAVAHSLNLPAIWLLHEIGLDKGYDKAKEFGLELTKSDHYWGVALGGLEYGTSPMTMASAYGVFANGGLLYHPHLITRIIDSTGAVIIDNTSPKGTRVITQKVADQMTAILLGTYSNGTGVRAHPEGYTVAGKTGTTEADFDPTKTKDQWMIAYTPDVVISSWLGFENTTKDHYLEGSSAGSLGPAFKAETQGILPFTKGTTFTVADAYDTDGKFMMADEVSSTKEEDQTTDAWKKDVDRLTKGAKEGLQKIGEKVKEKTKEFLRGLKDRF